MSALGFRALERVAAATPAQAERFRDVPVSTISDSLHRLAGSGNEVPLLNTDLATKLCGVALTVRTRPGDNLMVHYALTRLTPGDVLVIDAGGDTTNAIIGEIMLAAAVSAGAVGLVVDGAIRDASTLRTGATPVFARGISHRGPYKDGPGEVNVPVQIGGMIVHPGDVVVGDADGLVSLASADVDAVYAVAAAKAAHEEKALQAARDGKRDASWVAARLAEVGFRHDG